MLFLALACDCLPHVARVCAQEPVIFAQKLGTSVLGERPAVVFRSCKSALLLAGTVREAAAANRKLTYFQVDNARSAARPNVPCASMLLQRFAVQRNVEPDHLVLR